MTHCISRTKGTYNGGDLTIHENWGLSADGKSRRIQPHVTVAESDTDQTLVLEKLQAFVFDSAAKSDGISLGNG
jgi:hypothetical protein